ncbi:MAG TPA: hypothetical protein DCZ63_15305 [Geobacter sp.]|nr:hypothetical protein [Geobacter sp.]
MKAQLKVTTNYKMFQLLDFNRDVKKTRDLEASMKEHGFIPAYPLHVVKDNGKLKIKGGHHRFTVASKLGLPVYYTICEDSASIYALEKGTVRWSLNDYLTSSCRKGDTDCLVVAEYCQRTGIGAGLAIAMLGGESALATNKRDLLKQETYKITGSAHAEAVATIVGTLKTLGFKWATAKLCVGSLSRIVMAGHANLSQLQKKITTFPSLLQNQATLNQFTDMWDTIYNHNARGKRVPVGFLTNETMKERAKSFGKNSAKK